MSANDFIDACGFIPSSAGTGNFVVSAVVQGYQTPAAAGAVNGNVYSYRAESVDKSQWEEGFGAYTSSTTTLARTTITANSSGGTTALNFSAAPNVYITAASADLKNASLLSTGTLADARLSGNVALKASSNSYSSANYNDYEVALGASGSLIGSGSTGNMRVGSSDTGPAFGSIIRNGQYAINFGINPNNYFYLGGWSDGNAYRFSVGPAGDVWVPYSIAVNNISAYSQGGVGATNTAKAFASWVGTSGAIRGTAYNVSSVTRTAAGSYTVNFANAMPDTNYACMGGFNPYGVANGMAYDLIAAPSSTTSFSFRIINGSGVATDVSYVTFAAYGI